MVRYLIVSVVGGILFGIMDGVINANPLARRLQEAYKPIAKTSLNMPAGIAIDLVYGFIMAGVFLLLYNGFPGDAGIVKGMFFAILAWFFRVAMSVASQWMTYNIPGKTLLYTLCAGLAEMAVLGALFGLTLQPAA